MDYESYMNLCYAAAAVSVFFVIVSTILFFKLKILSVVGDLSGVTARKAIENIRNQNAATKNKAHKSSLVNQERGKVTDRITPSGKLLSSESGGVYVNVGTEKIMGSEETTVLKTNSAKDSTTLMPSHTNELPFDTDNFLQPEETTVLETVGSFVEIEEKITFIHSNESAE